MAQKCDFGTEPGEPEETYDFSVTLVNKSSLMAEFQARDHRVDERYYYLESHGSGRIKFYEERKGRVLWFRVYRFGTNTQIAKLGYDHSEADCRFSGKTDNLRVVYDGKSVSCQDW